MKSARFSTPSLIAVFLSLALLALPASARPSMVCQEIFVSAEQLRVEQELRDKALLLTMKGIKPNIVVLSASYGFGHKSAAEAIKRDLEKIYPNANVIIKDAQDFQNPVTRWASAKMYDWVTKFWPRAFDKWFNGYMKKAETIPDIGNLPAGKHVNSKKLLKFIEEQNATMVISAWNHATETLISLRSKGKLQDTIIAQTMTDYVNEAYFRRMGERIDMTFVPHKFIEDEFVREGLTHDKVATSGIPVSDVAYQKLTKEQRAEFMRARGLDPDVKTIFLMSGSAGVGDFPAMVNSMIHEFPSERLQIVVVTAKNEGHLKKLSEIKPPANINLKPLGKVPNAEVLAYMKTSDVIVTKTGGLTATEVMAIGKPAIFLDINGGQEAHNSNLFSQLGMGVATKSADEVGPLAAQILNSPEKQAEMVKNQKLAEKDLDRQAILRWILDSYIRLSSGAL